MFDFTSEDLFENPDLFLVFHPVIQPTFVCNIMYNVSNVLSLNVLFM